MTDINGAQRPVTVLLVEDDLVTREITGRMIARKFRELVVLEAENAERGVEIARDHAPDIVITDVNMPGMDGIEMAAAVRASKDDTHFIVVTAYTDRTHLARLEQAGLEHYLAKPIEFARLFDAIGRCLEALRQRAEDM